MSPGSTPPKSDPQNWVDHSNENPSATADENIMDIDPPFCQKESASSSSEKSYSHSQYQFASPKLIAADSSSAEDYRSVIDDLTVEIRMLRQELKRYKQTHLDRISKDKLFEIKVYGLPKKKKAELEDTLRDFAASLDVLPDASSSRRKTKLPPQSGDQVYSRSRFQLHSASSSSGSSLRLPDSAYASMSTGAKSSNTPVSYPMRTKSSTESSEQKVEDYLSGIPEGLYPRYASMTDKERKKLIVGRLEQLFAGTSIRPVDSFSLAPCRIDARTTGSSTVHEQPTLRTEPPREAKILSLEQRYEHSASNPQEDNTETRENGNSADSGTNQPLPMLPLPEQRPTTLRDLDPDRVQIPSENMDYIRHLGLVPPELLSEQQTTQDIPPDAEGWVYLNLLCNLAQLQILNVTPDFVRSAVSEMSAKLQLSPGGRKIRWRGGSHGVKFRTDSSGYKSLNTPSTNDIYDSERGRKRQKTSRSTGKKFQSGASRSNPQLCAPTETFHYKPLFAQQDSCNSQPSLDDTLSSLGSVEDSNPRESRWSLTGSGKPTHRKQRHEGAIIYYKGAPFCIDLSGDPGDSSSTTNILPNGQHQAVPEQSSDFAQSPPRRTTSGSFINYRPLTNRGQVLHQQSPATGGDNDEPPSLLSDGSEAMSDIALDWIWSDSQQYMEYQSLEPSGLGGILADDRFIMVVATKRSKQDVLPSSLASRNRRSDENTKRIIRRLATISTSSPVHGGLKAMPSKEPPTAEIEYLLGRIERPAPVSLPPPAIFFPPFSSNSCTSDENGDISEDADDAEPSGDHVSRRVRSCSSVPHPKRVYPSSGDEDDADPERLSGYHNMGHVTRGNAAKVLPSRPRQTACRTGSATSAAAESGYSSSCEDSS